MTATSTVAQALDAVRADRPVCEIRDLLLDHLLDMRPTSRAIADCFTDYAAGRRHAAAEGFAALIGGGYDR